MLVLSDWRIEQGESLAPDDPSGAEVLRWQDPATPLSIAQFCSGDSLAYRLRMDSDLAVDVWPDGRIVTR